MVARGRRGVTTNIDVLVVGAGPTGLTTALQACDHGATVRIVERRTQAFRPSRAMIMHPRTLESLRPLGVTDALLDRGDRAPKAAIHFGQREVRAQLANVALRDTAFPHLTLLRQMDAEEVLADALTRRGVAVERGVELVHAGVSDDGVHAVLKSDGATQRMTCRFIAGCDGPASTVREVAGIGWKGAPYREEVVLADAELNGPLAPGLLHIVASRAGLVFLFALGEGATWRILATRPRHDNDGALPFGQPGHEVPASDIQHILTTTGLRVVLRELRWSAQVPLQHRLATAFRRGALFLAGDAAHAHSPAAAQGMNTGILDAVNLGWKLAFAADNMKHAALLDSYEHERRPVARQVIALTHVVFFAEASTNPLAAAVRGSLAPLAAPVLPVLLRQKPLMAQVVRFLAHGWVRYRHSAISVEGTPGGHPPRPGDRLPDEDVTCDGRRLRLHELIARPGVHVLLQQDSEAASVETLGHHVTVRRLTSWRGHGVVAVGRTDMSGSAHATATPPRCERGCSWSVRVSELFGCSVAGRACGTPASG
jgi:2-polyprenyl-6-methoxyphenol hydroxylase-like FAD-dependent oxidoreductase